MQPQLLTVTHLEQSNLSLNLLPLCDAGSFYFRQCTQEFWLSGMHCALECTIILQRPTTKDHSSSAAVINVHTAQTTTRITVIHSIIYTVAAPLALP